MEWRRNECMNGSPASPWPVVLSGFQPQNSCPGKEARALEAQGRAGKPVIKESRVIYTSKENISLVHSRKSRERVLCHPAADRECFTWPSLLTCVLLSRDCSPGEQPSLRADSTEAVLDRDMPGFRNRNDHFMWPRNAAVLLLGVFGFGVGEWGGEKHVRKYPLK